MNVMKAEVYETPFGEIICGFCGGELECNDCGDMPDVCPRCGAELDYKEYDPGGKYV